jgi:predicted nucleotidyltransferase
MKLDVSQLSERTRPVFSGCSRIVAAYLFGSAASERMRPGSDVDIAVLVEEGEPALDRKALLEALLPPLSRVLRADVHLLFLNDASYAARAEVFTKGKLLYAKDPRQAALFRMKSAAFYAEFAPLMQKTRKGFQARWRRCHDLQRDPLVEDRGSA